MPKASSDIESLFARAQACRLCPRMAGRRRVLSHANGDVNADVLLIGEAPGRHGAEQTGVPFKGDASGDNLEQLLAAAGLIREEVFITNAVLCNPQTDTGTNGKPKADELRNCKAFLEETITRVDPKVVVTIGGVALKALTRIASHDFMLKTHAAQPLNWHGRILFPVYHMSPLGLIHRKWDAQIRDWQAIGALLQ